MRVECQGHARSARGIGFDADGALEYGHQGGLHAVLAQVFGGAIRIERLGAQWIVVPRLDD